MSSLIERYKQMEANKEATTKAIESSGALGGQLKNNLTETLSETIKREFENTSFEPGVISCVMPLTQYFAVGVRRYSEHEGTSNGQVEDYFNAFNEPVEDIPLASILIPLVNLQPDLQDIDPDRLIGRQVKVLVDNNVAISCELISLQDYAMIQSSNITQRDIYKASLHDLPIDEYLRFIGHSEEDIEDYLQLKVSDFRDGVIFRFQDEAYWDKDTQKVKDNDVFLDNPLFNNVLGRNYLRMKTQLCHNPIIMFSGK